MDNSLSLSAENADSFTATSVAKSLGLKREDVLEFLKLRGYIMREHCKNPKRKGDYIGTVLGIERGYVQNYTYTNDKTSCVHFYLTEKGKQKVEKAFFIDKPVRAEKDRIDAICREYEKNMRASTIGKAE